MKKRSALELFLHRTAQASNEKSHTVMLRSLLDKNKAVTTSNAIGQKFTGSQQPTRCRNLK